MDRFETLFGAGKKDIQRTCVISPFLVPKALHHLGIRKLAAGFLCSVGQATSLTFIKTQVGALFVGDAVLQLKETDCDNIIFFGSCGVINKKRGLDIGSLILPTSAYAIESFSDLVTGKDSQIYPSYPSSELLQAFRIYSKDIPSVSCVSFGSLELEDDYLSLFNKLGTDVIEMECAALFNAAKRVDKKAIAILFVSDILNEKLFWQPRSLRDKKRLAEGIGQACRVITKFAVNY